MNSISSIFMVLMLILVVMFGMQTVGNSLSSNSNLDSESIALISNFSTNLDNDLNYDTAFDPASTNLSNGSNFDSEDTFAREYLEGRNEGQSQEGIIARAVKIPDLIILSLGVSQSAVAWIKGIILLIITTILGFAAYRAFFGAGKVTEK